MYRASIVLGATGFLCMSTVMADNGTIRVNVEEGWGGAHDYIHAKCWAADGHGTTHWERIHRNNHKTCHGAYHMRVDFHVSHSLRKFKTWRFYRGQGKNSVVGNEKTVYLNCGADEVLKITVPKGRYFAVTADYRCQ